MFFVETTTPVRVNQSSNLMLMVVAHLRATLFTNIFGGQKCLGLNFEQSMCAMGKQGPTLGELDIGSWCQPNLTPHPTHKLSQAGSLEQTHLFVNLNDISYDQPLTR